MFQLWGKGMPPRAQKVMTHPVTFPWDVSGSFCESAYWGAYGTMSEHSTGMVVFGSCGGGVVPLNIRQVRLCARRSAAARQISAAWNLTASAAAAKISIIGKTNTTGNLLAAAAAAGGGSLV